MPRRTSSPVVPVTDPPDSIPAIPERFMPSMPTDGRELMQAWELPSEAWESTTVKTTRAIRGTQQMELLASQTLADWSLDELARLFGPGTYRVQAGPGPHYRKNSTITVSREYAANAGFSSVPVQTDPLQLQAASTFQKAQAGPVSPVELAAMIQTAVNNAQAQNQTRPDSYMEAIMKGFDLANSMSMKAMESAKTMIGIPSYARDAIMGGEVSWPQVVLELAPTILGTLSQVFTHAQATQPQPGTTIQTQPQSQPSQAMPTLPPPQGAQAMTPNPPQAPSNFPPPPPETQPVLALMSNYAGLLQGHLSGPEPAESLAEQLANLVGPALDPSIIALAEYVKANGPAILGNAGPAFATDRAASVVIEWARVLERPDTPLEG